LKGQKSWKVFLANLPQNLNHLFVQLRRLLFGHLRRRRWNADVLRVMRNPSSFLRSVWGDSCTSNSGRLLRVAWSIKWRVQRMVS
jgi:hypothetical protein